MFQSTLSLYTKRRSGSFFKNGIIETGRALRNSSTFNLSSPLRDKTIKSILLNKQVGNEVKVNGWVRTVRKQKQIAFAEISDGSSLKGIQAIIPSEQAKGLISGTCVQLKGVLVESPGKEQEKELQVDDIHIIGSCDETYPLQKKRHTNEFLRELPHLRTRTKTMNAVMRLRNSAILGFQNFFQSQDCIQVHTPIITSHDCEGGGEVFQVSGNRSHPDRAKQTSSPPAPSEFFDHPAYLTVSGQLHLEIMACAMSRVYTINPAFRAEESLTSRHLSEFWMLEAEISFLDGLDELLDFTESCIRQTTKSIAESSQDDLNFFNQWINKGVNSRIENVLSKDFSRMTYTEAIEILKNSSQVFQFEPKWGNGLQSEHEKWLASEYCDGPVFVTDYPKELKPFYMRVNPDEKTVSCVDLLVPGVGELIGGSMREERYDQLYKQLTDCNLSPEEYQWYLDLRKYGTVPHGGFGLGFERYIQYISGMESIRDLIPHPRYVGHCRL
ncbi:asparaginyl-tRNA synthetase [Basidiobolus ranarum]|uniref:asparagine--tRNA ligase n=1 Tax=Basidiobolus ranarum TaxID=34480 RepID=A0ABR2VZK7_9FUNG